MQSSSVSPATKRAAPSRMPWRLTRRLTRRLSAAAKIPFRRPALTAAAQMCASSHSCTSLTRRAIRVRWPSSSPVRRASTPGTCVREPATVCDRDEPVVGAVQKQHGSVDGRDVEAPGPEEREVVVQPAVDAVGEAVGSALQHLVRELVGQNLAIGRAEQRLEERDDVRGVRTPQLSCVVLEEAPQRRLAFEHGPELHEVRFTHAGQPVEPVGLVGRHGSQARCGRQPVAAERGARECVRATARDAPGREPLEPERVGDRLDIGRTVAHVSSRVPGGAAVARPVVADQPDALIAGERDPAAKEQPRGGRPVVDDDGRSVRIAVLVHREGASIPCVDSLGHGGQLTPPAARRCAPRASRSRCSCRSRGTCSTCRRAPCARRSGCTRLRPRTS